MLVKPSALTNARFASEYLHNTPNRGFQLRGRRWAGRRAAVEIVVRIVRRLIVIALTILRIALARNLVAT
jgi:hypothetical protein